MGASCAQGFQRFMLGRSTRRACYDPIPQPAISGISRVTGGLRCNPVSLLGTLLQLGAYGEARCVALPMVFRLALAQCSRRLGVWSVSFQGETHSVEGRAAAHGSPCKRHTQNGESQHLVMDVQTSRRLTFLRGEAHHRSNSDQEHHPDDLQTVNAHAFAHNQIHGFECLPPPYPSSTTRPSATGSR